MLKGLKKAHFSGEHVDVEVTLSSHSGLATVGGVRAARELAHPASGENAGPLSPMNALFLCAVAAMGATGNGFVLQPSVHARARLAPGVCHRSDPGCRGGAAALTMVGGKTLVLGATGKVGGLVVRQLAAQGTPVMALARSADSAAARELAGLANVEVRQGDVRELASLKSAAVGCENIVACYGMSPPRFPKLSDLWTDPFDDAAHPANINFKGVENIISAAKAAGVKKIVRLTGLSVGLSPWSPLSILFSIVLSFSNKWNRRGEMLLRESGLDYTIVRPGGLKDDPPAKERGDKLLLGSESWGSDQPPPTTGISRSDVASLLCLALAEPSLSRATLRINRAKAASADNNYFEDPRASDDWPALLPSVTPDATPLEEADYGTPVGFTLTAVAAAVGYLLGLILGNVLPLVRAAFGL